jgi:uncharacterized membrane protein (UPF0127 family)
MGSKTVSKVRNERTGEVVGTEIEHAEGMWSSFKGLMLRKAIPDGYGLLFRPARGIHTTFMRFPIDLIFLDQDNRVSKIRSAMKPWRFDFTRAAGVIEMNPGWAAHSDIRPGDQLRFEDRT